MPRLTAVKPNKKKESKDMKKTNEATAIRISESDHKTLNQLLEWVEGEIPRTDDGEKQIDTLKAVLGVTPWRLRRVRR